MNRGKHRIELVRSPDIGPSEFTSWRALHQAHSSLHSPFFAPEYALLVAQMRPDVRIAVIEAGQGQQAFFAIQSASGSAGLPIGAPLSDYQGLISHPDFEIDPTDLCRRLGVARFDFTSVPAGQRTFAKSAHATSAAWIADISAGAGAYFGGVRLRHRNVLYQLARMRRKLEREHAELVFTARSPRVEHLETLLGWKGQQLANSHQPLVWRRRWVRQTILRAHEQANEHFGGVLFTLELKGQLVAANFCLSSKHILHGLIMAHDRSFERYSPGLQLLRSMLEWAAANAFREVDFGVGDQLYKRQFGTDHRVTMNGWIGRPSVSSSIRAAQYAVRRQFERLPHPWIASLPGRVMRRLDVYRGLAAPAEKELSST